MHNIQKSDEKKKSISTLSLNHYQIKDKSMFTSYSLLASEIGCQQRQTIEGIDKLKLTMNIKFQYLNKRIEQSCEQNKKLMNQLFSISETIMEKQKFEHKNANNKDELSSMQKIIKKILLKTKQNEKKISEKYLEKCKMLEQKCWDCENKIRCETKELENEWETIIDDVDRILTNVEEILGVEKNFMAESLLELERQIFDIDAQVSLAIEEQQAAKKSQHESLVKLISRIMQKLQF